MRMVSMQWSAPRYGKRNRGLVTERIGFDRLMQDCIHNRRSGIAERRELCSALKDGYNAAVAAYNASGNEAEAATAGSAVTAAKTAYTAAKNRLPFITPSMSLDCGAGMLGLKHGEAWTHSGILFLDFDKEHDRRQLAGDHYTYAVGISAGGNTHIFVLIDRLPTTPQEHRAAYLQVAAYYQERYGFTYDAQCTNHNRLCYLTGRIAPTGRRNAYAVDLTQAERPRRIAPPAANGVVPAPVYHAGGNAIMQDLLDASPFYHDVGDGYRIPCPRQHKNDTGAAHLRLDERTGLPWVICYPCQKKTGKGIVTAELYLALGVDTPEQRTQAQFEAKYAERRAKRQAEIDAKLADMRFAQVRRLAAA